MMCTRWPPRHIPVAASQACRKTALAASMIGNTVQLPAIRPLQFESDMSKSTDSVASWNSDKGVIFSIQITEVVTAAPRRMRRLPSQSDQQISNGDQE